MIIQIIIAIGIYDVCKNLLFTAIGVIIQLRKEGKK
jgi:hypothetical protein